MLMKQGDELPKRFDLSRVRFVASVGEPLNPEAVVWGQQALGLAIHDNWWQTETGGIMIANYRSMDVKPGSMGKPLPGVEAAIVERTDAGIRVIDESGREGELALRANWPSMFRTYLNEEARYRKCFVGDWYLTGDLARRDDDGYYWFVGRADDLIKSSGHLIGPFEVESVLMEHRFGRRSRRDRQARSGRRRNRESVRRAEEGLHRRRSNAQGAARPRAQTTRRRGRAERNRIPGQSAEDEERQDHAAAAEGTRTRFARRRYVDAGDGA